MKNNISLILILLLGFNHLTLSQSIQINWGREVPNLNKYVISSIVGGDNNGIYVLRPIRKLFSRYTSIEKYDNNMNLVFAKELSLPQTNGKDVNMEKMFFMKNKLLLFTSFYNRSMDKNFAFASYVNDKGMVEAPLKEVDQINAEKGKNAGSFDFILSNDSSKILIFHNEPFQKKHSEKFAYKVMDNNLNVLWSKSVTLPYKDEKFTVKNYLVDNDGSVYLLGIVHGEKKTKDKPDYKYVILYYDKKEDKFKEYEVSLGDKFIAETTFKLDKNKNLVCAGFYANKSTMQIIGTFYLRIDKNTKQIISKGTKDFDNNFLSNFLSERKIKKGKGLSNYDLKDFIIRDDGGAVLIAEEYYVVITTYTDSKSGLTTTTYTYHYEDIIVVNINPDASIAWTTWVPKEQITRNNDEFSSYVVGVLKDKIYFVFNDNPKNITIQDPKKLKTMTNPRKSTAVLVTIDNSGKTNKTVLYNSKEQQITLCPKVALQLNDNETIIYGERGGKCKMGKMTFKNLP